MKICRFNHDRIAVVRDDLVFDVTDLFERTLAWPAPAGDVVIAQLGLARQRIEAALPGIAPQPLSGIRLDSPVANPGKIIGAPVNYHAHIDEANADPEINKGKTFTTLEAYGLFLKANSSLIGPAADIQSAFAERRTDHEVELAVVIGREARHVSVDQALDCVAGYTIALDMSLRGAEVPSYRKSPDTYSVLGPWLVTPDEIGDPDALDLRLHVNDELRQDANTSLLILSVRRVIAYASALYTLHPGDVIMTGTPAGVGPVKPGDLLTAYVENIGELSIRVANRFADQKEA
nr:fumarylacetoacetate hydrolase family protein [uncultured Duganella sp.]